MEETEQGRRIADGHANGNGHGGGQYNAAAPAASAQQIPPEPEPEIAPAPRVEVSGQPVIGVQVGSVNIFHMGGAESGRRYQYCCGNIEEEAPERLAEEDAMTEVVEVASLEQQSNELVTITEFARETGRSRQAVHQALPHITHYTHKPKAGGTAVIYLHRAAAEAWHRKRGRGCKKGHMPPDRAA